MKKPRKLNEIKLQASLGEKMRENERLQEELARVLREKEELKQELNGSRKESLVLRTEIHQLEGEVRGVERAFKIILANTIK